MSQSAGERVIKIFDTTLRDGEQSPGASMNTAEKIQVAKVLEQLNVDVIEAGFPISSPDDFEAVRAVGQEVQNCTVCGLARCVEADIKRVGEALKGARSGRIHVFCATSEIHRKHKLKRAQEEIVKMSVEGVQLARSLVNDVEFSPEDASRTEIEFLTEVVEACIAAGAGTINIPDTVGYSTPDHFEWIITELYKRVRNIHDAVISVHCHNDLGLAVANSLAAVRAGAGQVECTINGIGERAGNCSLEEVVMAMKVRKDRFANAVTRVNTQKLYPASKLISSITGLTVQRNKAIVGENAFAHEAGIHQHGMLMASETYEIMNPQDVGIPGSKLVLGKHSGRHAFRDRLVQLGHELDDDQLQAAFERFKNLADRKKEIFDEDLEAIVDDMVSQAKQAWVLESLQTSAGSGVIPTATVRMRNEIDGHVVQDAATGDGPVDAAYSAIQRITGVNVRLTDYQLRAITGGRDAQGEVSIEIEVDGKTVRSRAHSTDIIDASAEAFVNAINRVIAGAGAGKGRAAAP